MTRHGIGSAENRPLLHRIKPPGRGRFPRPAGVGILIGAAGPVIQEIGELSLERRLHSRHRARATVYLVAPGRRGALCKANNLSANGVFVETRNLGLAKGSIVELAFAINLGSITKIHRRKAIVAHVSRGGTGLKMECYAAR
jgi:hypothetical protein